MSQRDDAGTGGEAIAEVLAWAASNGWQTSGADLQVAATLWVEWKRRLFHPKYAANVSSQACLKRTRQPEWQRGNAPSWPD